MIKRLLVVEDDDRIASFVKRGFEAEGYRVDIAQDGQEGIQRGLDPYDAIILDLSLPGINGHGVCQALRRERIQTPILVLTGRETLEEKLRSFNDGADDYLTKPFAFEELLARIIAFRRRKPYQEPAKELKIGDLRLNRDSREVRRGTQVIALTRQEFDLLEVLMSHPDKALSRTSLLEQVWGYHYDTLTNVVEVYIGYLRKKIDAGSQNKLIQTVRDVGYKISGTPSS
jgi:DNA-binding response OmpR family regulator